MNEKEKVSTYYSYRENKLFFSVKRLVDILTGIVGILMFLVVYLFLLVLYNYGSDKGPILFSQDRVGKNGKVFKIYKFRSMVVNAEEKLKENPVLYQKYIENSYKLLPEEDPRITTLGNFIRKTSIDELPQFLNVLKGEMSLIGPRPVVEKELLEYGCRKKYFLSVKPGITGYWQVSGRSNLNYPERCDVELYYIENLSLSLDIYIFFKTIIHVVQRKGAY
ncbi:sugar transferase [Enterococcus sp. DIV0212c]|uniref:sugar transferase n=1 Tax=Enterococcus sp. DIV0212c TaxID=2230867 RepID=UPI0035C79DC5